MVVIGFVKRVVGDAMVVVVVIGALDVARIERAKSLYTELEGLVDVILETTADFFVFVDVGACAVEVKDEETICEPLAVGTFLRVVDFDQKVFSGVIMNCVY